MYFVFEMIELQFHIYLVKKTQRKTIKYLNCFPKDKYFNIKFGRINNVPTNCKSTKFNNPILN